MRLIVISTMNGSPWGGSEELWADVAETALAAGHRVAISTPRWPALPDRLADLGRKGALLDRRSPSLARTVGRSPIAMTTLDRWLRNADHDTTVLLAQGGTYDFLGGRQLHRALLSSALPLVVVCQYNDDATTLTDPDRALARQLFDRAEAVAFVAQANLDSARRQIASPIANGIVVRNPVKGAMTTPPPFPRQGATVLVCPARLEVRHKAQDVLIAALAQVRDRLPPVRVVLAGEGPDADHLARLADQRGVADIVTQAGQVDRRHLFADAHALVLPSRSEGTPLTLLEAMAAARPALVTAVGGSPDWVEDGESGWVARACTVADVAEALVRLGSDHGRLAAMGERARALWDARAGRAGSDVVLDHLIAAADR